MFARVIRKMYSDRNVSVVHAAIDQDRKDGMVKGRRRDLDASPILHAPVLWNDFSNRVLDDLTQPGLIVFRKVSALLNEVLGTPIVIHPDQRPPYLNIANILIRESMVPGWIASPLIQFEVPRKGLQHRLNWNRKETLNDHPPVFYTQSRNRIECQIHCRIASFAPP